MRSQPRGGFTLIELLTVIAIISILFGLVAVAAPRVLERTKIAATEADFKQIQTALATYQTTHGTLPPAYGYLKVNPNSLNPNQPMPPLQQLVFLEPYTSRIGLYKVFDLYDHRWSETFDTNGNDLLELLEFEPIPIEPNPGNFLFPNDVVYGGGQPLRPEHNSVRPFIYIPVNKEQARRVRQYYETRDDNGQYSLERLYAEVWDPSDHWLRSLQFPPPYYDDYVLISIGPGGSTGGIATPAPIANIDDSSSVYRYHVQALRAFYLATRDLNENGKADFDFRSRSQGEDGSPGAYNIDGAHLLPAQRAGILQRPYGPMIFRGQG